MLVRCPWVRLELVLLNGCLLVVDLLLRFVPATLVGSVMCCGRSGLSLSCAHRYQSYQL